jgi:hypothetical protein
LNYKQLREKNDVNKQNYENALLIGSSNISDKDVINIIGRKGELLKIRKDHKTKLVKYSDVANKILSSKYYHTDKLSLYLGFYNLLKILSNSKN